MSIRRLILQVLAISILVGSFILALDLWATRGRLVEVKPVWFVIAIVLEIVVLVLLYRIPDHDGFPEPEGFEVKLNTADPANSTVNQMRD